MFRMGESQDDFPADALPIRISVRDTGIGVPQDKQTAILDAFTQADPSTTRRFGGTGLGLAISRQLVELMHGKLAVESRVGHGTTFSFHRRVRAGTFGRRGSDRDVCPSWRTLPVLVVDDNPTNRRILKEI